ncbi:50S ribosomal protein L5 [Candidatus Woesearchaeota archaeon]|nr:50S ribosomal protein L5 [Candidatus Woesearchaeota archaeon]
MNKMKDISIEKVNLNIGAGGPGDKLDKAMKLLANLSGAKPIQTITQKRIPTWGVRPGLPLATKVTIRKKKAIVLLSRLLTAVNKTLKASSFDNEGNFSFGINEYLDIPGAEYDAEIGIIGLEVAVTLQRAGFRVKKRILKPRRLPRRHRINRDEAIAYIIKEFGVNVE